MSYLKIGSGDVPKLLSGLKTKGYADLWHKFLDEHPPYYNALASPIDALRTGAILEDVYLRTQPMNCFTQEKFTLPEMDVFTCSVDFSIIEGGKLVDIEELKTIFLPDYLGVIQAIANLNGPEEKIAALKKKFKNNYNQIQFQLMCTGLDSGKLVFLSVDSYEDHENATRVIKPNEITRFHIPRDEEVIELIKERGKIFQQVKDHFK